MRVRPLNSKEIKAGSKSIVHPVDDKVGLVYIILQWNLTNPNSLGPELVQISEMFGLMKQYI